MTTMTLDTLFDRTAFPSPVRSPVPSPVRSPVPRPGPSAVPSAVSRASSSVRLTRRGRLVVVVVALLVAFAVGVFVTAAGSVATQRPGTPEPTKIVQVGSGDTLWDIASGLADDGDVRAVMEEIKHLNALDSADLQAGQRLVVPAG
jgi:LysM repeat protein